MSLLRVSDLVHEYPTRVNPWVDAFLSRRRSSLPGRPALAGVSFQINEGEGFGLVGESGSGKTTLALCILRLIEPSRGRVEFAGRQLQGLGGFALRQVRRDIGVVFQDPFASLNPFQSIGRIIAEPLVIHGIGNSSNRRQRVMELLENVGMRPEDAQRRPHEFSGGQRQRIALARALAAGPRLLIADEPVSSLDASLQAQIIDLLIRLRRDLKLTLLLISHSLPIVRRLCEGVAVIKEGKLVESGPTESIFERPTDPHTKALLKAAAALQPWS